MVPNHDKMKVMEAVADRNLVSVMNDTKWRELQEAVSVPLLESWCFRHSAIPMLHQLNIGGGKLVPKLLLDRNRIKQFIGERFGLIIFSRVLAVLPDAKRQVATLTRM